LTLQLLIFFLSEKMLELDVAEYLQKWHRPFIFLTENQDSSALICAARQNPKGYITNPFNPNDVEVILEMFAHQHAEKIELRGARGIEEINPNDISRLPIGKS
jgi:AmiR/NasT family two-component response regulator